MNWIDEVSKRNFLLIFREIANLSPCFAIISPKIRKGKKEVKGSLRFNYMTPVPDECIEKLVIKDVDDEKYRLLLNKEYQFCMDNAERIQKKANKIYEMVTTNRKQILTDNSCAFHILEAGYHEYIKNYIK